MPDLICPMLREPCIEHRCKWYIQLLGAHPQTGEQMSKFGCAIEFTPLLLVENAKEVRQHAAAVESMRNEARRDTTTLAGAVMEIARNLAPRAERVIAPRVGFIGHLLGRKS